MIHEPSLLDKVHQKKGNSKGKIESALLSSSRLRGGWKIKSTFDVREEEGAGRISEGIPYSRERRAKAMS